MEMGSGSQPQQTERNRWQRLPTWAKWTIGIVAAFILMAIGGAIVESGSKEDELKDEIASLEARLTDAEADADDAEARADEVLGEAEEIEERAHAKAEKIVAEAKKESSQFRGRVVNARQELEQVEGDLSATESELGGAEERVAKGTIENGVWQLEADYLPGTYEAPGGPYCYWELRSSLGGGNIEEIIENGGSNSHQILTIEAPYFSTEGCGNWKLIE